ncbi:hypothetical protein M9Y10_000430 [Tritrichomonas musculus]|uniref:DUF3447 domain-containing protein n=1 Tax=Tritrichomonas musculus TaxID=1915356 RepID=A0ABR2L497_9EUKA
MNNIQAYLDKKKKIHSALLNFLDNDEDDEENFQNLNQILDEQRIQYNMHEIKSLFHTIVKIANNHFRRQNFFAKLEKILQHYKNETKFFPNYEIFNIFKSNKRLLLFLLNEKVLKIDKYIISVVHSEKYQSQNYHKYFETEIKLFLKEVDFVKKDFEINRKIGENEDIICQLIRDDKLQDFISYINTSHRSLKSDIQISIFETNQFLLRKTPTLIEYSAFFGSFQIFEYLFKNKVKVNPSIWIYATHGNNADIIFLLENSKIKPDEIICEKCIEESIKCHHNDFKIYFQNTYFPNYKNKYSKEFLIDLKYFNFAFIENKFSASSFYYLCKYDYYSIVFELLRDKSINTNQYVILTLINFYKIYKLFRFNTISNKRLF